MNEELNNDVMETEVVDTDETYDLCETDDAGNVKAVAIGATAAAIVTAGIYGGYKLVGKAKAAWKRHKLKKQAEEEIAQAEAFEDYDQAVDRIHEEQQETE